MKLLGLIALILASAAAQDVVNIHVEATARTGLLKPIYAYFGYDEPNYTYMKNGRKLVGELSALSPVPVYIRAHHLLCTGDGAPALKWGSTNAYTEDAQRQTRLRLDHRRPHLRHLHSGQGQAVCRNRLHAGGALDAPRTVHAPLAQT